MYLLMNVSWFCLFVFNCFVSTFGLVLLCCLLLGEGEDMQGGKMPIMVRWNFSSLHLSSGGPPEGGCRRRIKVVRALAIAELCKRIKNSDGGDSSSSSTLSALTVQRDASLLFVVLLYPSTGLPPPQNY